MFICVNARLWLVLLLLPPKWPLNAHFIAIFEQELP